VTIKKYLVFNITGLWHFHFKIHTVIL